MKKYLVVIIYPIAIEWLNRFVGAQLGEKFAPIYFSVFALLCLYVGYSARRRLGWGMWRCGLLAGAIPIADLVTAVPAIVFEWPAMTAAQRYPEAVSGFIFYSLLFWVAAFVLGAIGGGIVLGRWGQVLGRWGAGVRVGRWGQFSHSNILCWNVRTDPPQLTPDPPQLRLAACISTVSSICTPKCCCAFSNLAISSTCCVHLGAGPRLARASQNRMSLGYGAPPVGLVW